MRSPNAAESLFVEAGHRRPPSKDRLDPAELTRAQGAGNVRQAIVEADLRVLEPVLGRPAPVVSHRPDPRGRRRVSRHDDASLPRGHLLVGIESEDSEVPQRPRLPAGVFRADGFAGVLDHREIVAPRDLEERVHLGRASERVDHQERAGARRDRRFDPLGVDVEHDRIDVDEHGRRPLVAHGIGCRDEGERGHDHLVAFAEAQRARRRGGGRPSRS